MNKVHSKRGNSAKIGPSPNLHDVEDCASAERGTQAGDDYDE